MFTVDDLDPKSFLKTVNFMLTSGLRVKSKQRVDANYTIVFETLQAPYQEQGIEHPNHCQDDLQAHRLMVANYIIVFEMLQAPYREQGIEHPNHCQDDLSSFNSPGRRTGTQEWFH